MEQKKQYTNGEKVVYFSDLLKKAIANVKKYEALVERFAALPADEFSGQNWKSDMQQQLDLEKLRAVIREAMIEQDKLKSGS